MKTSLSVNSANPIVDIIIPTYNNTQTFWNCLKSLILNTKEPFRLVIVNNGDPIRIDGYKNVVVIQNATNLGWMGGINAGIKWCFDNSKSPFICFLNDDIQILDHDYGWLTKMIYAFQLDDKIGAVGPTSNAVMAYQSIQHIGLPPAIETTMLSGMCLLTKRSVIEKIGFLDETLCGGDDIDYSIRLADAGYKLCICRRSFILHHCSVTGKKLFGDYWNSKEQYEAINNGLIKKHGFKKWYNCANHCLPGGPRRDGIIYDFECPEKQFSLSELKSYLVDGTVLDLGCGGNKIDPHAIGVDIRANGAMGVGANLDHPSNCDITADVTELKMFKDHCVDAILASHILEHIIDIPKALKEWKRALKVGGKLVIISPDYRFCEAISVDPSHVHALTAESVISLADLVGGFKVSRINHIRPGYVFCLSLERLPVKSEVMQIGSAMMVA